MSDQSERIVKKLWSYCQVLRDDGLSYQDYLEQFTFLLFLKMADERTALTSAERHPEGLPVGRPRQPEDGRRQTRAALPRHAEEAR